MKQEVPNDYDAYVRIFHPATDADGNPTTWAEVARRLGRTAHREMQWHRLVGADYTRGENFGSEWRGGVPNTGELDEEPLEALCRILESHTQDAGHCFFGLSTIHGGVAETYPDAIQLRLPSRDFVIFSGPLAVIGELGYDSSKGTTVLFSTDPARLAESAREHWWNQAPNLIWPADRSWYVATEYDFDSTLVGGSRELANAILAAPALEAWEVERRDSLQADADKIN